MLSWPWHVGVRHACAGFKINQQQQGLVSPNDEEGYVLTRGNAQTLLVFTANDHRQHCCHKGIPTHLLEFAP